MGCQVHLLGPQMPRGNQLAAEKHWLWPDQDYLIQGVKDEHLISGIKVAQLAWLPSPNHNCWQVHHHQHIPCTTINELGLC